MAKKTKDLKPDIVVKNYWNNNEHFADLFNAKLFHGKQVIKADELEDADTEESSVLVHKEYAESIQASRDNMIQASKGHAFHACMKKHDFGTRKTPKIAIFRRKMSGFEVF